MVTDRWVTCRSRAPGAPDSGQPVCVGVGVLPRPSHTSLTPQAQGTGVPGTTGGHSQPWAGSPCSAPAGSPGCHRPASSPPSPRPLAQPLCACPGGAPQPQGHTYRGRAWCPSCSCHQPPGAKGLTRLPEVSAVPPPVRTGSSPRTPACLPRAVVHSGSHLSVQPTCLPSVHLACGTCP